MRLARRRHPVYDFCLSHDKALYWPTRYNAGEKLEFISELATITSSLGGSFVSRDFRIEKLASGKFVIYYEAPVGAVMQS